MFSTKTVVVFILCVKFVENLIGIVVVKFVENFIGILVVGTSGTGITISFTFVICFWMAVFKTTLTTTIKITVAQQHTK